MTIHDNIIATQWDIFYPSIYFAFVKLGWVVTITTHRTDVTTPIAYYLIYQYTADFVVKAPISIGIFVVGLLLVSLISFGTLYWQIRKAANINPADVVKSE